MYDTYKRKIIGFWGKHKRMPGYTDIMKMTGLASKNSVYKLINKLVEEGVLSKDKHGKLSPGRTLSGIPLLGLVEAGFPTSAEEELLDVMDFDEYLTPNKESSYVLKVKGESMIDAGICPGDLVIVERRSTYKPGQIVIASIEGEYTMKYLRRCPKLTASNQSEYYLEAANPAFKPIYPKTLTIEAVVTGVVRKY